MRTFVMSDIHGNNKLFQSALRKILFKKTDKLILLGDLIDRGKESKAVLDTVLLLLDKGYNVELIMGNHEAMFLDAFQDANKLNQWLLNGGDKTLLSFLTSSIEKIPKIYFDLIKSFKYYIEEQNFILVHAAINMKIEYPYSDIKTMLWEREPSNLLNKNWLGNRRVIHGHNPKSQTEILKSLENKESIICIDNGCFLNKNDFGSVCILQLENLTPYFII